jgi:HPt (histidine-containing phosphotransfer) domain-containing protein
VQRIAHTVKGAVDSCGASRAYDAAMVLERMGRGGEFEDAMTVYATLEREVQRALPELAAFVAGGGKPAEVSPDGAPGGAPDRAEERPG